MEAIAWAASKGISPEALEAKERVEASRRAAPSVISWYPLVI